MNRTYRLTYELRWGWIRLSWRREFDNPQAATNAARRAAKRLGFSNHPKVTKAHVVRDYSGRLYPLGVVGWLALERVA